MITIKKGNHTLQVSKNTYETMFKIMGYTIVDEKEEAKKEASSTNDNIQTSDIEKNTIIDANKTNQDKELDDFLDNISNLSDDDKKEPEINSDENKEASNNKSKNDDEKKDNSLENILGMLSNNIKDEDKKKNNRQSKNKEEK